MHKEPRAVEVIKSSDNPVQYEVRGYWEGDDRAGQKFESRGAAVRWANSNNLVVCTRPTGHVQFNADSDDEY